MILSISIFNITSYCDHYLRLRRLFEHAFDAIAALTDVYPDEWAMLHNCRRINQTATDGTTALSQTPRMMAIEAIAIILGFATNGAALCPAAIWLPTILTNIALHGDLHRMSIAFKKFADTVIALPILFCHRSLEDGRNFHRHTWIK